MIIIYYNSPVPTRHQQRPVPFSTLLMSGKTVPGSLPAGASLSPIQGAVRNLARSSSTYYPLVISHSYGSDGPLIDDLPKYYNMYIYIYVYIRKHIHEQPLITTIYYIYIIIPVYGDVIRNSPTISCHQLPLAFVEDQSHSVGDVQGTCDGGASFFVRRPGDQNDKTVNTRHTHAYIYV